MTNSTPHWPTRRSTLEALAASARFEAAVTNAQMYSRRLKSHCELSDPCLLKMKQAGLPEAAL